MSLLLAHDIEVPKERCYQLWHSPKQCEFGSGKEKIIINVKMNRVFGSPYKFSLYSHYTHFPRQYSIALPMSCTLCALTQMLHELKWRQPNTILQNGTFGETAVRSQPLQSFTVFISPANSLFTNHTHRNPDTVAPDSTASITMSPLAKISCCITFQ